MVTGSKTHTSFQISDDIVAPDKMEECHLSIQIEHSSYCWCLTLLNDGKIVELGRKQFSEMEEGNVPFPHKYGSTTVGLHSVTQSLIPESLFDANHAARVLSPSGTINEVRTAHVQDPAAKMVFEGKSKIEGALIDSIPGAVVKPNLAWTIQSVMKKNRIDRPPQLYVDIANDSMEVVAVAHKELLLANSFSIASDEDTLYHISNVMKVLGLDNEKTTVLLSGDIEVHGPRFELYKKYLHNPEVTFGFSIPRMTVALSSIRKQNFVSLFNQFTCVS